MKFSLSPRLALLIIAAMFLLPLLLAWLMYSGSLNFKPASTRNLGTLIEPPVPIDWTVTILLPGEANLAAGRDQGSVVFSEHWVILQPVPAGCDDPCLKEVSNLRQIHRASGRQQFRIRLALLLDESSPSDQAQNPVGHLPKISFNHGSLQASCRKLWPEYSRIFPARPDRQKGVYMIDPLGNIMMYYQAGSDPNYIKQDMKRLLTWSKLDKQ